ncbi:hypothetical protein PY365_13865 [Roseiarcaceae bacterium H3SJ34-1]|uniref:hypothetical protein n=1 Tax=Terripilifer ovatus TaxID=3032367 RepID=UPI003AB9B162|nr:hypothetical protein [Roseiarcaceae bacterium H3SJ34-1]
MTRSARMMLPTLLLAVGTTVLLAGCNSTQPQANVTAAAPPAYSGSNITPSNFRMPEGSGCSGDVARWQAVQDNDLSTGNVNQSVYNQIKADIDRAAAACQAGRSAEASSIVRASRARHGYPGG